jgi:CRP-like cAMP-binding protein
MESVGCAGSAVTSALAPLLAQELLVSTPPLAPKPFLDLLSPEDRSALIERCGRRTLGRRQLLFVTGEPRGSVYLLRTGRVKLVRRTDAGGEVIVGLCGPGDIVGYSGLSALPPRMLTAQVIEAGEAHTIDEPDFRSFLTARPVAALAVIEAVRRRLETLRDSMVDVVSEDVPHRILRLLRRLAIAQGQRPDDPKGELSLDLRLTHQEVANMIGARRQTVTTAINDMHRNGELRRDQHRIVIGNPR